jgi:hypothetical protein
MMTAVVVIEAVVIVLLAVLVAGLLRSHAEILRRLHELGAGDDHTSAPVPLSPTRRPAALQTAPGGAVTGVTPQGATVSVSLAGSRGFTLLAFLSSGCGTCKTFWTEFGTAGHQSPRGGVRTVIVTKSAVDESLGDIRRLAPADPLTIMSSEAWDDFQVPFTPYFVLVDTDRGVVVGDGAAAGWQQLVGLVDRALGDASESVSLHRSTADRLADSEEEMRRAGIAPGDPALYQRPTGGLP